MGVEWTSLCTFHAFGLYLGRRFLHINERRLDKRDRFFAILLPGVERRVNEAWGRAARALQASNTGRPQLFARLVSEEAV